MINSTSLDLHKFMDGPDQFIAWLERKDPDEQVGIIREFDQCPIARFLSETVSAQYATVESVSVGISVRVRTQDGDDSIDAPDWAQDFIVSVDGISHNSRPITAKVALANI